MSHIGHLWRWRFDSWLPSQWDYLVTAEKHIDMAVERLKPTCRHGEPDGYQFAVERIEYVGTADLEGLRLLEAPAKPNPPENIVLKEYQTEEKTGG